MNNILKITAVTAVALALTLALSQVGAQARYDFAGSYDVDGVNPDGSKYTQTVVVTDYGDGYRVMYNSGETGIATDLGDTISVASQDKGIPTVSVFKIINDHQVAGFWQSFNSKTEGKEVWTEH